MSDHLKKNLTAADVIKDRRKGVKQPIATYCPEPEHGTPEYFLHLWVEQLDDHLAQDKPPNQHDWMHFRPNQWAAEALQKLTTQNPLVVHQLNTTLEFTNRMFDEFLNEVDDGSNFWDAKISLLAGAKTVLNSLAEIPPDRQSRPMSKSRAAKLLGFPGNSKKAAESLTAAIEDGVYRVRQISRQSFVFDVSQFPETARRQIQP